MFSKIIFTKRLFTFVSLLPIIFLMSCQRSSNNETSPSGLPVATANTLTVMADTSKACAQSGLDFCVREKLPNTQAYMMTLTLDKGSVALKIPVLTSEQSGEGFTLTPNAETCSATITSAATPCSFILTYAPREPTLDDQQNPTIKTLTLNFTYINNLQHPVVLTENINYQAFSLLSTSSNIPSGVDLAEVVQSSLSGSHVALLTKDNTLYSNLTSAIPNIESYNTNQLFKGIIVAQTGYPFEFLRVDGAGQTPLFSSTPLGIAVGKNATYGFFDDGSTACSSVFECASSFAPVTYPKIYARNYHFVDTSGPTDKLYVYSNNTISAGAYLTSLDPRLESPNNELATSPVSSPLVIPNDENTTVQYSLAVKNNIFVVLNNSKTNTTTLQYYVEDDVAKSITLLKSTSPATATITSPPVYDPINNILYFVTTADNLIYTLQAINPTTGMFAWSHVFSIETPMSSPFLTNTGNIIVVCEGGHVYAFKSATGSSVLTYPLSQVGNFKSTAVSFDKTADVISIPSINQQKVYLFHTNW